VAKRSDTPTKAALAVRRSRALRDAGYAPSYLITNAPIIAMLVQRGKVPRRDWHTDVEVEKGLTALALELSGEDVEKTMKHISSLVGERWHSAGN
jgi:hypothetical protein